MIKGMIRLLVGGSLALLIGVLARDEISKISAPTPIVKKKEDLARNLSKNVRRFTALQYGNRTYGTGFNMKYKGKKFIITNQHVCAVSKRLGHPGYAIVNGSLRKIIAVSKHHDLCALEADFNGGLELSNKDVEPLDKIILMGHPRGLDLVIREGRIVKEDIKICVGYGAGVVKCRPSDMISATAYPGNSGSPVLNEYGKVVGVLYAGSGAYPHEPFIVPFEYLQRFLNSLVKEKNEKR